MPIRPTQQKDEEKILDFIRATKVFNDEEIAIAKELLDIYLNDKNQNDYEIFSSVNERDEAIGYVCFGQTPATQATYDLYWIAVDPNVHNKGIGTQLLQFTEKYLKNKNARLIIAETSSTSKYESTRAFYIKKGFEQLARINEYYKSDDDLLIYGKYL
ncbi:MAG: GNAT family N-acetyltransferase [Ignavibacteriales bacterium]|nr:GNAT family N-acetyltransferase [Ignavibacteriales bacterium]